MSSWTRRRRPRASARSRATDRDPGLKRTAAERAWPTCATASRQTKEKQMQSRLKTTPTRSARIITFALSLLVLSSTTSVRAQGNEKAGADAEFLSKAVPGIAASVEIIDYAMKH